MTETLAEAGTLHGFRLRVLSKSYPMDTNMKGLIWFSNVFTSLCFG